MWIISADLHGTAGQTRCNQISGSYAFSLIYRIVVNQDGLILVVYANQTESNLGIQIRMSLLCSLIGHNLGINISQTDDLRLCVLGN